MFDRLAPDDAALRAVEAALDGLVVAPDDAGRIDQVRWLETIKRKVCAAQVRVTDELARSQRAAQLAAGVPSVRASRGVADQVARARRESPRAGDTFVGVARALVHEMPCTYAALADGRISEWTATCLVRETAVLDVEHRAAVDTDLAGMLAEDGTSHGRLVRAARGLAQRVDPAAAVKKAVKAAGERRVSLRPAPDGMVWFGALLPLVEGAACYAGLDLAAASARAQGDPRSRGQVMADTVVARLTGRDPLAEPVPVRVDLVMTTEALLGGTGDETDEAATVRTRGLAPLPVPAPVARDLVARAGAAGRAWVRRLFTTADRTSLVAMDSRARRFPAALAELVTLVDQTCRTPWCDAPVRVTDHALPVRDGGTTAAGNGQGLCERCNYAKDAVGWTTTRAPDGTVTSTTPTGHTTTTRPPPPLGWPPSRGFVSYVPVPVDLVVPVEPWHDHAA